MFSSRRIKRDFLFLLLCSNNLFWPLACAQVNPPPQCEQTHIPTSISKVETSLVGDNLVRVIQHNMVLAPHIEFELLSRPSFQRLDAINIDSIPLKDQSLSFTQASGVFVEDVKYTDINIEVVFEYFPLHGESYYVGCTVTPKPTAFAPLTCAIK